MIHLLQTSRAALVALVVVSAYAATGCAKPIARPMKSMELHVVQASGEVVKRMATPEQRACFESWRRLQDGKPFAFGKIQNPDVTGVITEVLQGPAGDDGQGQLYLQIGANEVVIYRKSEFRFTLTKSEMEDLRKSLGLPQVVPRPAQ